MVQVDHHHHISISLSGVARAAADQGHAHSSYNLAAAHLNGHETDLEEGEEEEMLERALVGGVDEAQQALEHLCATGGCRRGVLSREEEEDWDQ